MRFAFCVGLVLVVLAIVVYVLARVEDKYEAGQAMPLGGCLLRAIAICFGAAGLLLWLILGVIRLVC